MLHTKSIGTWARVLRVTILAGGLSVGVLADFAVADEKLLADSSKLITAKQYDRAIRQLTGALAGGKLSPAQTAKAMYLRGRAYQDSKRYAQAVADLTGALWLNGLSPKDRAGAAALRLTAYKSAGVTPNAATSKVAVRSISEPSSISGDSKAGTWAPSISTGAPAHKLPASSANSTKVVKQNSGFSLTQIFQGGGLQNLFSGSSNSNTQQTSQSTVNKTSPVLGPRDQDNAPIALAPVRQTHTVSAPSTVVKPSVAVTQPAQPVASTGWSTDLTQTPVAPTAALQSKPKPVAKPAPAGNSTLTSLFGSLFGGTSAPASKTVSNTPTQTPSSQVATQTSSWSTAAEAAPKATATKVASVTRKSAPVKAAIPAKGRYRIQIAAVRSEEEAQKVVRKLQARHSVLLASRSPLIDQAVIGNMGRFYRVRLGPYASNSESAKVCGKLRQTGFDCFVVTQ